MIKRDLTEELLDASREYPVVTVFGPRQSGKTTLVQMAFPDKSYWSLEDPDVRLIAQKDPRGFLADLPQGGILDEIQRAPHLLSYIQGLVDRSSKTGMFILTGSHQPELHQAISQSLAGRTAVLTLFPFCLTELRHYRKNWKAFELAFCGGFPRLHEKKLQPGRFFNGYLQTYVERDVRALLNLKDLGRFQQFLSLVAGRVGQVVNYTSLSNDIGVSSVTIKSWISVLKASYVLIEMPPYFENIGKRVIKTPKIYFTDTGLAAYLLGITSVEQMIRDPLRGSLYENLLVMEMVKSRLNRGLRPEFYFYRDSQGNEVDLILREGRNLIPVEIKSASTFTEDFVKGIAHFRKTIGSRSSRGYVFYNGDKQLQFEGVNILNPFSHELLDDWSESRYKSGHK